MFPAPINFCKQVNISTLKDEHYKNLVQAEYRIIRKKISINFENARSVYQHKMTNNGKSKLSQRCNDFKLLEIKCKEYIEKTNKS